MNDLTESSLDETVIRPVGRWSLGLRELWAYRELAYFLAWRDVKVRYKQTLLGAAWALLQPLVLMGFFTLVFSQILSAPSEGLPYPVFSLSALVPWTLFASVVAGASDSLVANANLVSKVYFPRLILPLATVGSYLLDFVIALVLLAVLMVLYGVEPTVNLLWLPVVTAVVLVTALAGGIWMTALNVKYRDVRYVVPFALQLGLLASPIAYSTDVIPDRLRPLYAINPMTGLIDAFRWCVLGTDAPREVASASIGVTVLLLVGGVVYFRRLEASFADII